VPLYLKLPIWANPHPLTEACLGLKFPQPSSAQEESLLPPPSNCIAVNVAHRESDLGFQRVQPQLYTAHTCAGRTGVLQLGEEEEE
jgi:hypothetical protein